MNPSAFCESGNLTETRHEVFSLKFELTNFDIQETYVEIGNTGNFRRKVTFPEKTSASQIIGQSIDFPTSWCVNMRSSDTHARIAFKFHNYVKDGVVARPNANDVYYFAILKFRMKLVDKDGDVVHEKQWRSWTDPKKIYLTEDYAMIDFIELEYLFDNQGFMMSDKTIRVISEGMLYSPFIHSSITVGKYLQTVPTARFLDTREYHDVELFGETGTGLKAHKMVLSCASPALKSLLQTVSNEAQKEMPSLILEDLCQSEVSKMLEYIYTGNIKTQDWSNLDQVEKLLELGKNYELRGLRWLCYSNLLNSMTLNSFLHVVRLFQKNSVEKSLWANLNRFYMKNQTKLLHSESFRKFADEEKEAFLYVVLFGSRRTHCP